MAGIWMVNQSTGQRLFVDESVANLWTPRGYVPESNAAGTVQTTSGSSIQVDPTVPYQQKQYELGIEGANAETNRLGAQTGQFNAQTQRQQAWNSLLGTAAQAFINLRGPENIYQAQALMAGNPRPGLSPTIAALGGLIGGLPQSYVDPRQYRALDWQNSGFAKLFGAAGQALSGQGGGGGHGGGGGGSDIAWKQKLERAGIRVGDANPDQVRAAKRGNVSSSQLQAMQDGRYGMSNRALPYEQAVADPNAPGAQPGSGGAPHGVRVTNGHAPDDPSGDHTPRNDDGTPYTGPIYGSTGQTAAGGVTPEQNAPGITRTAADYAAQAQAAIDAQGSRANVPTNGHVQGEAAYAPTGVPAAPTNSAGQPLHIEIAAPSPPPAPPNPASNPSDPRTQSATLGAPSQPSSQSSSQDNSNRDAGGGGGAQFSASGRNLSGGTDKSDAEKAADHARRKEEERAMGGVDILPNGTPAYARHYQVSVPIHLAGGGSVLAHLHATLPPGDVADPLANLPPGRLPIQSLPAHGVPSQGLPIQGLPSLDSGNLPPTMLTPGDSANPPDSGGPQGTPQFICTPDGPDTCTVTDAQTGAVLGRHVPEAQLDPLIQSGQAVLNGPDTSTGDDGGPSDAGPSDSNPGASGGMPMPMAMGGLRVVTHPSQFQVGQQPFLVGEPNRLHPDGADEVVSIAPAPGGGMAVATFPLQNPQRPVTAQIAHLANALVPGSPYHATSDIRGIPAYARNYQVARPMAMAGGGVGMVYGIPNDAPLTLGTLKSANKPFKLSKDEKTLGLYPEGKYISSTGQIQAPGAKGGYKTMPEFKDFPIPDESNVLTTVAQDIANDPVLQNSLNSALSAAGRQPASYWARINAFRAPQQAPGTFAARRIL